jgi:PncC family amidohydrolase
MKVEQVNKHLREKGLTLGSVESFTGGLFAQQITSVSGASKFYKGGYVTYATEEKVNLLLIPQSLVDQHGVVSKEIAYYMANNARQLLKVDVCVSFTGNAGPDAMEGKPVGEVHICVATKDSAQVYSLLLEGNRNEIQQQAVDFALDKLLQI